MQRPSPSAVILAAAMCLPTLTRAGSDGPTGSLLARSRAVYARLHTYLDRGVVQTEYRGAAGPPLIERHTFTTVYRAPRQFLLDFHRDPKLPQERYVVWGDDEAFHTWWSETRVQQDFPKGRGATAFALSALPTHDVVTIIPPLLFANAGLQGAVANLSELRDVGPEAIDGLPCEKLEGRLDLAYRTGNVTGAREVMVWIDRRTLLVRRVFEDTPQGSGTGVVSTVTFTFSPTADPALDRARFRFAPPQ